MLNLNFKNPKEIKNELSQGCECVALILVNGCTELVESKVRFEWVEYDKDDNQTGSVTIYHEDEDFQIGDRLGSKDTYEVLEWSFNGLSHNDIDFIMTSRVYNEAIDNAQNKTTEEVV